MFIYRHLNNWLRSDCQQWKICNYLSYRANTKNAQSVTNERYNAFYVNLITFLKARITELNIFNILGYFMSKAFHFAIKTLKLSQSACDKLRSTLVKEVWKYFQWTHIATEGDKVYFYRQYREKISQASSALTLPKERYCIELGWG